MFYQVSQGVAHSHVFRHKLVTKYRQEMECLTSFAREKVSVTTWAFTYSSHYGIATFMSSLTAHSAEYAASPLVQGNFSLLHYGGRVCN